MKKSHLGILALSALLFSCDDGKKAGEVGKKPANPSPVKQSEDERFGAWMSKAQLRFQMEQPGFQGHFYSQIEGRLQGNANQFRAITEKFESEKYREWTAVWGVTEEELFEQEIVLLREGFERHHAQTFTDTSGTALHQLVMLCSHEAAPLISSIITGFRSLEREPLVPDPDEIAFEVREIPEVVEPAPPVEVEPEIEEESEVPEVMEEIVEETPEPPVAEVIEEEPEPEPEPETIDYKVVAGDTLSSIARRHDVSVTEIKKANSLRSDVIQLKQILRIPKK